MISILKILHIIIIQIIKVNMQIFLNIFMQIKYVT